MRIWKLILNDKGWDFYTNDSCVNFVLRTVWAQLLQLYFPHQNQETMKIK